MDTYLQTGLMVTCTAPAGGCTSGTPYLISRVFGVAANDAAAAAEVELQTEGVFTLPKEAPLVIAVGVEVFWDDANAHVGTTRTDTFIGIAYAAAASAATTVEVRLIGQAARDATHDISVGATMANRLVALDANGLLGGHNITGMRLGQTLPVLIQPNGTVRVSWVCPCDLTITGIGVTCQTSPTTAGTYTMAVADDAAANLLNAATFNLDATITADTYLATTLTATTADLDLDQDQLVIFTFVSNNADLTGADLVAHLRYTAR